MPACPPSSKAPNSKPTSSPCTARIESGRSRASTLTVGSLEGRGAGRSSTNSCTPRSTGNSRPCWSGNLTASPVSHLVQALETFRALGIEFVSLTEGIDTTTPTGKMIFTIMGAVAEFERDLIRERVNAGLRAARARGQKLGRPRVTVDAYQIAELRQHGQSWKEISQQLGIGSGTARRAFLSLAKKPPEGELRSALEST